MEIYCDSLLLAGPRQKVRAAARQPRLPTGRPEKDPLKPLPTLFPAGASKGIERKHQQYKRDHCHYHLFRTHLICWHIKCTRIEGEPFPGSDLTVITSTFSMSRTFGSCIPNTGRSGEQSGMVQSLQPNVGSAVVRSGEQRLATRNRQPWLSIRSRAKEDVKATAFDRARHTVSATPTRQRYGECKSPSVRHVARARHRRGFLQTPLRVASFTSLC